METTKDRLSRVTKGLLNSLELCEKEIRDCYSQKDVREQALKKNVVDTKSLMQQIRKYDEVLQSLKNKHDAARSRAKSSEKEIKRLQDAIKICSSASENLEEIRSLVENYKASLELHKDIVAIASLELEGDEQQVNDLNERIDRLNQELKKASNSLEFPAKDQYIQEINELEGALDILTEDRGEILAVLDELDRDREKNGKSKLITASASKKRKLDDSVGFDPESRSPRATKRTRPAEISSIDIGTDEVRDGRSDGRENILPEYNQFIPSQTVDLTKLFSLFLPPIPAKLTGIPESPFNSIQWESSLVIVPLNKDLGSSFFFFSLES